MTNPNFHPKKSLGQNFLHDKNILQKIIAACNLTKDDSVLEIGAGTGMLTETIALSVKRVIALEIDNTLCQILKDRFEGSIVEILCQDILEFDFKELKEKTKVIGNLPYYISTPIISHLLKFREKISSIFISLQKELAERLVAQPGGKDYGSFSIFTQYYTEPKILFEIKKGSFKPKPKVDSCFLELKIREKPAVSVKDEKLFFDIIHAAFQKRRKTIVNALDKIIAKEKLLPILETLKIDKMRRPETLSLEDFSRITNEVKA